MTSNCSCINSLSMHVSLYETPRVQKHKLNHIMICSKYDYSLETLILRFFFPECSVGLSSLVPFPVGDIVVSLTSLSAKRDNRLSAYTHIDSICD